MRQHDLPKILRRLCLRTGALAALSLVLPSLGFSSLGLAQDVGSLDPDPLPAIAHPTPGTPAKQLFGRETAPADLAARTIGFYSRGCLSGGIALPVNGPDWQVMRVSRNRYWGVPISGTTIISTSGSNVRRGNPHAKASNRWQAAKAATRPRSNTGSRMPSCIRGSIRIGSRGRR
jgi:hypothetical protein